MLSESLCIH